MDKEGQSVGTGGAGTAGSAGGVAPGATGGMAGVAPAGPATSSAATVAPVPASSAPTAVAPSATATAPSATGMSPSGTAPVATTTAAAVATPIARTASNAERIAGALGAKVGANPAGFTSATGNPAATGGATVPTSGTISSLSGTGRAPTAGINSVAAPSGSAAPFAGTAAPVMLSTSHSPRVGGGDIVLSFEPEKRGFQFKPWMGVAGGVLAVLAVAVIALAVISGRGVETEFGTTTLSEAEATAAWNAFYAHLYAGDAEANENVTYGGEGYFEFENYLKLATDEEIAEASAYFTVANELFATAAAGVARYHAEWESDLMKLRDALELLTLAGSAPYLTTDYLIEQFSAEYATAKTEVAVNTADTAESVNDYGYTLDVGTVRDAVLSRVETAYTTDVAGASAYADAELAFAREVADEMDFALFGFCEEIGGLNFCTAYFEQHISSTGESESAEASELLAVASATVREKAYIPYAELVVNAKGAE